MRSTHRHSSTYVKTNFGALLKDVQKNDIIVRQYGEAKAVLIPFADYETFKNVSSQSKPKRKSIPISKNLPLKVQETVKELQRTHPDGNIVFNKNNKGKVTEIICELIQTPDFSKAVAVINKTQLHYHKTLTETYLVTRGRLQVILDNKEFYLDEGESITFFPYQQHRAIGNETWIEVYSQPGWRFSDHILV